MSEVLGQSSTSESPIYLPDCVGSVDIYGDHQVGCGGNGDHISRHTAIWDVIFSAAQCTALAASKVMPTLVSNSLARPADILSLTGAVVALLLLMFTSFPPPPLSPAYSYKPFKRLPPTQAKPSRWVSSGSYFPTSQLAARQGLASFPLLARHWVVTPKTQYS